MFTTALLAAPGYAADSPGSITGTFIRGALPYAVFEKAIEEVLANQKK